MKNVCQALRPAWSQMDSAERRVILITSILVAGTSGGEALVVHANPSYELVVRAIWAVAEIVIVTLGCVAIIRYYKNKHIGCYPSTYLYCFVLPEAANPDGERQVVGYCSVEPDVERGEIRVHGASYFWVNEKLDAKSRVRFSSTGVTGSKEGSETTCHIRFKIDEADSSRRFYKHGVLQFRLDKSSSLSVSRSGKGLDQYAGFLEAHEVGVRFRGYAEWLRKGPVTEQNIIDELKSRGGSLVDSFQELLKASPQPTLWEGIVGECMLTNYWGHNIPTPQSVVLNDSLKPYIDRLLSKMLRLAGFDDQAIAQFQDRVQTKAVLDRYDTRVAYERHLKAGLIGMTSAAKLKKTLTNRAKIVKGQIEPYLVGESLLDIGCGNGIIASLVKERFRDVRLLDVVDYTLPQLQLRFDTYKEEERLPTGGQQFDSVLLLTVLHHSNNPVELLRQAWDATAKRLVIIESVIGVHSLEEGIAYELADSSEELQIGYAAFIDWFYNRVLHDDVPVPYNFTSPERWSSVFAQHHMPVIVTKHLGQDIDIGPEYHVLFVLEKPAI
jgi:SAM-dependent methyltransferase